jgi:hypothetical protein
MKIYFLLLGFLFLERLYAFPQRVVFRSNKSSFNRLYNFHIEKGKLWISKRDKQGKVIGEWSELPFHNELEYAKELSVDSSHVIVIDKNHRIFSSKKGLEEISQIKGTTRWGLPFWLGPGFNLPSSYRNWSISNLDPKEDKYWIDPAGNKQGIGQGVASVYVLGENGQTISYTDPWLPLDYSYRVCGPHRGRFIAEKLSVSGSTFFVINRYGDMYTRTYDFDISGADTLFFRYTYDPTQGVGQDNPNILSGGVSVRVIPIDGWTKISKITGTITDEITIIKTGVGAVNRILRVEGISDGQTGYFTRQTKDPGPWEFVSTNLPLRGNILENASQDLAHLSLGETEEFAFGAETKGLKVSLLEFNPFCSPAKLRLDFPHGAQATFKLHHHHLIRLLPREPGLLRNKKLKMGGAIEVPQEMLDNLHSLDGEVKDFISKKLKSKRFSKVKIKVNKQKMKLEKILFFNWRLKRLDF